MLNIKYPKVLILLPFCNEAEYLDQTLKSLVAQDFTDWILFAQDNFSDDNSLEIVRSYQKNNPKIRFASLRERVPVAQNWNLLFNTALTLYSPEYITWLGGDDFWHDNRYLGELVEALHRNPQASASIPKFMAIDANGKVSEETFKVDIDHSSRLQNISCLANNWANALAIYGLYKANVFCELAQKRNSKISKYEGSDWCWSLTFVTHHHCIRSESATYVKTFKSRQIYELRISRIYSHVLKTFSTLSPIEFGAAFFSSVILSKKFLIDKIKF
jgi:teichuronic acid biosynthesis glycosyltransferase TuaG